MLPWTMANDSRNWLFGLYPYLDNYVIEEHDRRESGFLIDIGAGAKINFFPTVPKLDLKTGSSSKQKYKNFVRCDF